MLLALITNLGMGGGGTPVVPPEEPQKPGAGGGRRHPAWWEGEWIIPGVTHYLPEAPPEDVVPLRPKVDALRDRAKAARPPQVDPEYRRLSAGIASLVASLNALERRARAADEARAIVAVTEAFRALLARTAALEASVADAERREARRRMIVADDEEVMKLIMELI